MRTLLIAAVALTSLVEAGGRASAGLMRWFDLHDSAVSAAWVVHGRLDAKGNLTVDATLKGKATEKQVALTNGAFVFAELQKFDRRMTSAEVVVFLDCPKGKWQIQGGTLGVVGFMNNGVYYVSWDNIACQESNVRGKGRSDAWKKFRKRS